MQNQTAAVREAVEEVYAAADDAGAVPIHLVGDTSAAAKGDTLTAADRAWFELNGLRDGAARKIVSLPSSGGAMGGIALGIGNGRAGDPCGSSALLLGQLAQGAPAGTYRLAAVDGKEASLAAVAWGLGGYRYRRYKTTGNAPPRARLALPKSVDRQRIKTTVEAVWLGRDLINTPASDLGPAELESAARDLAAMHGATVTSIVGDDLLKQNFPMIHAVGRASVRAPRLIDLKWSKPGGNALAPRVTLVGKGICFDTGGLDIKPSSNMLLMKKDMGGAATVLALGHMIMSLGLDVRLRILIPAAENSISGDAFRPSDILRSRAGLTVEVGNTDAEGRLVLADALALADEEKPDTLLCFATLTGAARVALGPDLPALFTDDDALATAIASAGLANGDPVWRLPLWPGYMRNLDSEVADMGNVSDGPFSGAITAALFLKRFVANARRFAHIDLYGWRTSQRPLGPKGGEPQTARAVFDVLAAELADTEPAI
ncbi:MAG: leucyl aminopeptidase family protein [Hyphomicrobiaceae bacterium]|nr:leucyl aminopeptidase family protein [Hyphomicrobiaceae bacterium]